MTKDERIRTLEERIAQLEARIATLEFRPPPMTITYTPADGPAPYNPFPSVWISNVGA